MRAQRSGRIIITASVVSHVSMAGLGWYASTKHAIRAVADALRQETRDLGIDVVLIEPGAVRTGFDQMAFQNLDAVDHPRITNASSAGSNEPCWRATPPVRVRKAQPT